MPGKAVTYTVELARGTGAAIYLLHVIAPVIDSIRQPYALHERLQEEIENARLQELKFLKDACADVYPTLPLKQNRQKEQL